MPNKVRIIQKEWVVLTKPYVLFSGSPVVTKNLQVPSPCQTGAEIQYSSIVNGDKGWTEYKRSTSFAEIRNAVRGLLYEVGLKKEHIQVVEFIDHDYIITPLT